MRDLMVGIGLIIVGGLTSWGADYPESDFGFRLWEFQSRTNVERRTFAVDCSKDVGSFRIMSANAAYSMKNEDGVGFVRFAEDGDAYAHGLAPKSPIPVIEGRAYTLALDYRSPQDHAMVYLQFFDATGKNISKTRELPDGWTYTPYNEAWYFRNLAIAEEWTTRQLTFAVPSGAVSVLPVFAKMPNSSGPLLDCRSFTLTPAATYIERREISLRRVPDAAALTYESAADGLRLQPTFVRMPDGSSRVKVVVTDCAKPPRPRALEVGVEWRQDLAGWTWHSDWSHDEPIERSSSSRSDAISVSGMMLGVYPFTAVSKDGAGLAIGTELDDPAFEAGTVSPSSLLSVRALGLLPTRPSAALTWMILPFKGTWGFRSAAKAYYASQAAKIPQIRTDAKEGTRCYLGIPPEEIPESPDDFGLAYYVPCKKLAERLAGRERGMLAHPYMLAWQVATARYPVGKPLPPMEVRIDELQSWLTNDEKRVYLNSRLCKRDLARMVLNSMPLQADGSRPLSLENYGWISHYWRLNVDPRIAAPNASTVFWSEVEKMGIDSLDGIYLDNVYIQNFNNVRPDHLAVMTEPLVFDRATAQPCAHAMQHQVAFVKGLAERLHAQNKRVTGNVFPGGAHRFNATIIDIFGCEVGSWGRGSGEKRSLALRKKVPDEAACEQRFYAYHRPVANLLQDGNRTNPTEPITAEGIAAYVDRHLFYGFYPSVVTIGGEDKPGYIGWKRYLGKARQYERDRALFKAAIPVIRRLNKAGWEPETLLRADVAEVRIERYGSRERGEILVTVRNNGDLPCTTRLTPEGELATAVALEPIWHGEQTIDAKDGVFSLSLPPHQTLAFVVRK